jgi:thioredoxin
MKNTFTGLIFLSVIWLSSCGGAAKPEKGPDSMVSTSGVATQAGLNAAEQAEDNTAPESNEGNAVIQMTKAMFLENVYNYEKNPKQWTFIGDKPCVIDFYADWCRPCKMVAPIMDELAEKYKGQITIYRVNTDQERELAQFFGIRSIPTVFFCPMSGDPQMTQGALPKDSFEKIITDALLQKK